MTQRKTKSGVILPHLVVPSREAARLIQRQAKRSDSLASAMRSYEKEHRLTRKWLDDGYKQLIKCTTYNNDMLHRLFDSPTLAQEYGEAFGPLRKFKNLAEEFQYLLTCIEHGTLVLESILERLDLMSLALQTGTPANTKRRGSHHSNRIFLVHGADGEAREATARCLEKLGLVPIILQEQANRGRTLIEKFEGSSDVTFAVVLLTPDDVGARKDKQDSPELRARQNVIFELGYFVGKLGRNKVCVLYKEGVIIPSDYFGVAYVPMDSNGAWKGKLAQELKQAGIDVDINQIH
ncbi:MAG: nucleotide-binding protein [Candidatus Marsarchaeota archaeon]|nr:nucleotide-binding protein [Candidatus Marsarchaeota archaeon]